MNNIINLTKMSFINLKSVYKQIWFVWVIWIGIALFNPFFLNILLGLSVLLTLYQVMAYEDHNHIDYLIAYLPVKKNEYVISRYLLGIGSLSLSTLVMCIIYFISAQINPSQQTPIELLLPTSITSAILAMCVIIPLVLKFGINKGRIFMSIIVMLISTLPMSIVSDISQNPNIIDSVRTVINHLGMPLITVIINIVIILISMVISIKLYKNKEIKE